VGQDCGEEEEKKKEKGRKGKLSRGQEKRKAGEGRKKIMEEGGRNKVEK
jgi:hypothetical protein